MEENKQNQEMVLSSLQSTFMTLQEKLNQQEVVNNNLIHEMLHLKITDFKRRNTAIVLTYMLLATAVCWSWYCFELRLSFMVLSLMIYLFLGLFDLFSSRKVRKINTEDADIQTTIKKMKSAQTRFALVWIAGVLTQCLWMMWFVTELGAKHEIAYLRPSFVIVAAILTISSIMIIGHIDRLVKMSNELLSLTELLNDSDNAVTATYHHGIAYWTGCFFLVLSIIGLVFKLMHWPFANLVYMAAVVSGVLFVLLTGHHFARIIPDERPVIRLTEIACLLLVANAAFRLFHWPFGDLFGIVSIMLLLFALLVYGLKSRRASRKNVK